ncbi:MAG: dihydrolipoamide acetyltransferase family protein [Crocinitomicaceae bacterium]|jgi:2-oxoglutarate dehydrogenase E2 component (dihydrolipoamide succinyltransferase)|tara:strand:+ start:9247 stop:10572 length:1326 start_codon:yes stop_codon:yes gene_type:complete
MAEIEIRLPKMGESVTEATITNWLKNPGDIIAMDEPLVEVATDKVDNELPSEAEGVLIKQLFQKDEVAQVGDVIAIISTDSEAKIEVSTPDSNNTEKSENLNVANSGLESQKEVLNSVSESSRISKNGSNGKFYSPLVRSIAEKEGLSQNELEKITGSGAEGRVTKKDVLAHLTGGVSAKISPTKSNSVVSTSAPKLSAPVVIPSGEDQIIEMDRMRKIIADHMVMSKQVSPHVTSYVEADVTNLVNWRNKIKKSYKEREGENITFTPILIEAIVKAIKDFPMINVSVSGTQIIVKKNINIGMATALPTGNLIVPVIKNADRLSLTGLTQSVNKLAANARDNKLKPEDIQGGTYTVTNVGSFGNVMGTPIINQPQAAIMALGAIRKVPAVIETPDGDFIGIRHKMFLSHAYDHRVIDGALGGRFVRKVADYLEEFDINRDI